MPKEALGSLDAFNSWNVGKHLRGNVDDKQYKYATYIEGDFNASADYFDDLAQNTEISNVTLTATLGAPFSKQEIEQNVYNNVDYNLFKANCLQKSVEGLNKGTLPNGVSFGKHFGTIEGIIPKDNINIFADKFNNNSFTKPRPNWANPRLPESSSRILSPKHKKSVIGGTK